MATMEDNSSTQESQKQAKITLNEKRDTEAHEVGKKDERQTEDVGYKTGVSLWILSFSLLLILIMITLDISIVATAIPRITDDFHTIEDLAWYASAYLITNCILQPFGGQIYSHFPFKQSFIAFAAIFELGSVLCGVSVSSTMLIVGRAVCGIGGSGLMNGSLSLIGIAAPPSKRSVLMGLFMTIISLGQVIGPLIGGLLTQYASWRWCFYINLPIGGVAVACFVFVKLPSVAAKGSDHTFKTIWRKLDILGLMIFAPATIMLLMALQWGGSKYSWSSATEIGLLCGSAATFVIFVFWELRQGEHAMIPSSIMRNRRIYGSCLTGLFQGASILILIYFLPLWFQVIEGKSPTESAVSTLPSFLAQVILAFAAGFLIPKVRYLLPFMVIGNVLVTISFGLFSTFTINTGMNYWIGYQVLNGAGRGMTAQIPPMAAQASVEMSRVPTVTALVVWSQLLGGAVFLSLSQTLFQTQLRAALHEFAPQVNANEIVTAGATGYAAVVPPNLQQAISQAYNQAIAHTYYLGIGVGAASLCTALLLGSIKVDSKRASKKPKETELN